MVRVPGAFGSGDTYLAVMNASIQVEDVECLVVLGAGFVGASFAERVADRVGTLRLTTRSIESRDALRAAGYEAHALDFDDRARLVEVLDGATHVVFSAAAGRGGSYDAVYDRGTAHLVDATDARIVYTSSTGVYAADDGSWVDEDAPLVAREGRGGALRAGEDHVLGAGGLVLRLSGLIGRERGPHRRVEALAGTTRDDGDAWLNLAPLPLVLDALEAAITSAATGALNVSASAPLLRRAFYDAVLDRVGAAPIRWTPGDGSKGRRIRVDRLRTTLGVDAPPLDLDALL